jgi:hypothetical protein
MEQVSQVLEILWGVLDAETEVGGGRWRGLFDLFRIAAKLRGPTQIGAQERRGSQGGERASQAGEYQPFEFPQEIPAGKSGTTLLKDAVGDVFVVIDSPSGGEAKFQVRIEQRDLLSDLALEARSPVLTIDRNLPEYPIPISDPKFPLGKRDVFISVGNLGGASLRVRGIVRIGPPSLEAGLP